jgi:hypothetical protein
MAYTVTQILQIADICEFLAADNQSQGYLFRGNYERTGLSRLIYIVKSSVNWLNSYSPSNSTLLGKANYLFSLCQPFVGQALQIIGSGSSGTIINPATGVISTIRTIYLEFIVGTTSSPQVVNGVNVTLPVAGANSFVMSLPNIMNGSVGVTKDTVPLPTTLLDRYSFTPIYTSTNITITLSPSPNTVFMNGDLIVVTGLQFITL